MFNPAVFKAYDVRGLYPSEITEELFHQLGRAFVAYLGPGRFAVTRDMRVSSPSLTRAFIDGVVLQGGTVLEQIGYFNPVARGKDKKLELNLTRIAHWTGKGATMSDRVRTLVSSARKQAAA